MKQFDTVEKALDELKQGHLILVTDDEDRENEGDLICAASLKRRPPVFLPRSEVLRRARAWIRTQSRRISAARDICFR